MGNDPHIFLVEKSGCWALAPNLSLGVGQYPRKKGSDIITGDLLSGPRDQGGGEESIRCNGEQEGQIGSGRALEHMYSFLSHLTLSK